MKKIILAITGASGSLYAVEFLKLLTRQDVEVHGIISKAGAKVLDLELGLGRDDLPGVARWFNDDDFTAPMASGSSGYDAMVVLPCTMGSLAAIASGLSLNLVHRAADVILKERRTLILAARETPLNRNHLQNMLSASDAGAIICPPMPAFYMGPKTIEDLAVYFASRLVSQLGLEVEGFKGWQGLD